MFLLYVDKIPLLLLSIGVMASFALPSTHSLDSPRFLCIYFVIIVSCGLSFYLSLRHGTGINALLISMISIFFIIMLPVIKTHFS